MPRNWIKISMSSWSCLGTFELAGQAIEHLTVAVREKTAEMDVLLFPRARFEAAGYLVA